MRTNNTIAVAAFALVLALAPSASALPIYFDQGLGLGTGSTKLDGDEMHSDGNFAIDVTMFKLGYGPFGNTPIYAVLEMGGMAHNIGGNNSIGRNVQFNTYSFGPGIIYYPMPLIQLGASLGYSWIRKTMSGFYIPIDERVGYWDSGYKSYKSDGGVAWNISAAVDLGGSNHGCLIGLKYFSATNTLQVSKVEQKSSMIGVFIKYAYRHKVDSIKKD